MGLFDSLKNFFSGPEKLDVNKRFELLRSAISGTMSRFFMAKERATGKVYGLKIVDMEKLKKVEERFKGMKKPLEGEIAVQFQHPYIVHTYEYGMTTKGEYYLLMEYLGGRGVNTILGSTPEQLDGLRLKYLRQGAEALQYVHEKGFIHRDVCPRNFILTQDGKTMKLTDFGLTVPATPLFMQPGNRTGTPNYMAPELARRRPTNHQLDVFAFGVTAYEILTGRHPWDGGTDGRAALEHDRPPVELMELRPQTQPQLAKAVMYCVQADPLKRCPDMKRFLQMVSAIRSEDV